MLCERCHKRLATLRFTEVVNGKAAVRNICRECLDELQNDANSGFEVQGAPTARQRQRAEARAESAAEAAPEKTCPSCGIRLDTVLKDGRVGCVVCFDTFREPLESLLRGVHTALRHRGKSPRLNSRRDKLRTELQSKRALLRSALKSERYEEAAVLRDEIRGLEEGLEQAATGQN